MGRRLAALLVLSMLGLAGCALDPPLVNDESQAPAEVRSGRPGLDVDAAGNLTYHGHPLALPCARDDGRFGATFVDVTPLPSEWRPLTAPDGGIVVAAVRSDSPLALVGVRPFQRIVAIDGVGVASVGSLVARLAAAKEGDELHVTTRSHVDGDRTLELVVTAGDELDGGSQIWVPCLFEHFERGGRDELTFGPFDSFFYTLTTRTLRRDDTTVDHEWGAFFNLVLFRSRSRVRPDGTLDDPERHLRLFYFVKL